MTGSTAIKDAKRVDVRGAIDLSRLKDKFRPDEIEWRVQKSGKSKKSGKDWAMVLAYIDNRAIQDRLDDVCGPDNWSNRFKPGPDGGVVCEISIQVRDGVWVTKEDGAENTNIEPVKGGLSGSMKRAASQWGIGRYLYDLESTFVEVTQKGKNRIADSKNNVFGYWDPPALPKWALPQGAKPVPERKEQAATTLPAPDPEEEEPRATRTRPVPRPDNGPARPDDPKRLKLIDELRTAFRDCEACDEKGRPVWSAVATTIQSIPGLPEFDHLNPSFEMWTNDQLEILLGFYAEMSGGA